MDTDTVIKPNQSSDTGKKEQVEQMFDSIAPKYDFLNHFLSMGIDKGWRKKAIASIATIQPKVILDVATGTADLAIAAIKLNPEKIIGIDISQQMLNMGIDKVKQMNKQHLISLTKGDSEQLPFEDNKFDAITVAFGVRNFENLHKGLSEMQRVLKQGGIIAILEFSKPRHFPYKQVYNFYFSNILPFLGRWMSKSANAYAYLPESVKHFPDGKDFIEKMEAAGFKKVIQQPLTFGTCSLYNGTK